MTTTTAPVRSTTPARRAAQGLATLALLKVNFDRGRDHLDMFMPFVADCVSAHPTDDFTTEEIRASLVTRHGLSLPESVLATLLVRSKKRGDLTRQAGRYIRMRGKLDHADISSTRDEIAGEHANVAEALRQYAATRGLVVPSDEEALALILRFFERFHVAMLVDEAPGSLVRLDEVLSRREAAVVARFLERTAVTDPARQQYVTRMLEGYVLQNALLLKDISIINRRFRWLAVYLDTGFILRVLGLAGEAHASSTRETLDLLRATGADLRVFERTLEEVERILRVYQNKLRTHEGILSLRPTDVTRHLLVSHYKPSDVATAIALIRQNLTQLGIVVRPYPERDSRHTLDERSLTDRLRRPEESELEPRVTHDVDSVAAILTLRQGERPRSLDNARAVFATTSASVIQTVRDWYRACGESGVPPVVHAWALSNAAWLKKPTAMTAQKLHELVALCSAALSPNPKAWRHFVSELKRLGREGQFTSSQQVAVVVRELAACNLCEIEGEDPDCKTIAEVIERAREEEEARTRQTVALVQAEGDRQIAKADEARLAAEQALADERSARASVVEAQRQQDLLLRGRALTVARIVAGGAFLAAGLLIALGVGLMLPTAFPEGNTLLVTIAAWGVAGLVAVFSVMNLVSGTSLQALRAQLQVVIERKVLLWFSGNTSAGR